MLLSEGYLVYHGPRRGIEEFFADLVRPVPSSLLWDIFSA